MELHTRPHLQRREERRGGRPAAGTDPQKRRQILEGAGRIFSTLGFDAASMSDVAREAQVSKATLYVYFQDKEHLFTAICAERRDRNISELIALLDTERPPEAVLIQFGTEMMTLLSDPFVVAAHRIVIGVAERMPEVGTEFFEAGPKRMAVGLGELHRSSCCGRADAGRGLVSRGGAVSRARAVADFPSASLRRHHRTADARGDRQSRHLRRRDVSRRLRRAVAVAETFSRRRRFPALLRRNRDRGAPK